MAVNAEGVYHERQRFQFCLLHCLNNLLQGENAFTRKELDEIADSLAAAERAATAAATATLNPFSFIFKPHRNAITGNYDANVLDSALKSRGKELKWFNNQKGLEELLSQVAEYGDDKLLGMIVNFTTKKFLGLCQGRHWVAVRKLKPEGWYNLDSERVAPVCLGNDDGLKQYLKNALSSTDNVVMFVLNGTGAPSSQVTSTDNGTDNDRVAPE